MLFADFVHFSRMTERQVIYFAHHVWGTVADLLRRYDESVVVSRTWGDALCAVFTTLEQAGRFALDLRDTVVAISRADTPLPACLNLRVALHAGPVYHYHDPVTKLPECTGTHVSRAARLEPKTPPGEVYASEAFAALATLQNVTEFTCDYVRQLEWAKHYGTFPTYVVRRRPVPK